METKDKIKFGIKILLIIIFGFAFITISLLPDLKDFRNSIYGLIFNDSIVLILIIFLSFSKKISMPIIGKITIWIFGLIYVLFGIINIGKIEAIFFFVYAIINIIVTLYVYKKTKIGYKSIWFFGAFSYLITIFFCFQVKYINGEMNLTFLYPSIIVTSIAFVPGLIYAIAQFILYRNKEKLICVPLLCLLCGFIFTWLTMSSMNVYLDRSKPRHEEYIIIDKRIKAGSKQITTYELKVQKEDANFFIGVSEVDYYDYEINDTILLSIYSGAFNEPYYIYDRNTK